MVVRIEWVHEDFLEQCLRHGKWTINVSRNVVEDNRLGRRWWREGPGGQGGSEQNWGQIKGQTDKKLMSQGAVHMGCQHQQTALLSPLLKVWGDDILSYQPEQVWGRFLQHLQFPLLLKVTLLAVLLLDTQIAWGWNHASELPKDGLGFSKWLLRLSLRLRI